MKYRKLRIAWSVGCGVLCLLLIALWVRSYQVGEGVYRVWATRYLTGIGWNTGTIGFSFGQIAPSKQPLTWTYFRRPAPLPYKGFQRHSSKGVTTLNAPFWFLTLLTIVSASVLVVRYPYHFSLRTLLIGMTVVAVALGLILAVAR